MSRKNHCHINIDDASSSYLYYIMQYMWIKISEAWHMFSKPCFFCNQSRSRILLLLLSVTEILEGKLTKDTESEKLWQSWETPAGPHTSCKNVITLQFHGSQCTLSSQVTCKIQQTFQPYGQLLCGVLCVCVCLSHLWIPVPEGCGALTSHNQDRMPW